MRLVSTTKAIKFILIFLSIGFSTQAQENSPYSRFGLGDFFYGQHIIARSMGGVAAAYGDGQTINFINPAMYSDIRVVTYDIGLTIDNRTLKSVNPEGKFKSVNFTPSYLSLATPLNKKKQIAMAFGLRPLSRINYSVENRSRISGIDSVQTIYEGEGGLNQFFWGFSKKWKNINLGFNTGYNFGRKEIATKRALINDTVAYYRSNSAEQTSFGGLFFQGGIAYTGQLSKKDNASTKLLEQTFIRLGASYTMAQKMSATKNTVKETITFNNVGAIVPIDTVYVVQNVKGKIEMPSGFTAGMLIQKTVSNSLGTFDKWLIGIDYTATQWSNYRYYNQKDALINSAMLKVGAQLTPNPLSTKSFWSRVNYRAGFFSGKDYINVDGNELTLTGFTFGAGLPIRKWRAYDNQFTQLNIALEAGKRGSKVNNITENFFRISVGMSLSDIWFIPRKYN